MYSERKNKVLQRWATNILAEWRKIRYTHFGLKFIFNTGNPRDELVAKLNVIFGIFIFQLQE